MPANALYDLARQSFLSGGILMDADTIKAVLVNTTGYVPNLATNQYFNAITAGARLAHGGTSVGIQLTSPTILSGVFDANDVTLTAVASCTAGDGKANAIVIYQATADSATSKLIAYIETATGLPLVPNGGDVTIQWDSTAGKKIFML